MQQHTHIANSEPQRQSRGLFSRLRNFLRERARRRLQQRMAAQAQAALLAHARGDHAAYIDFANAARATGSALRAHDAVDWTLQTR